MSAVALRLPRKAQTLPCSPERRGAVCHFDLTSGSIGSKMSSWRSFDRISDEGMETMLLSYLSSIFLMTILEPQPGK